MEKSGYLRNRFTDFDDIWHDNASGTSATRRPLKLMEFEIQDGDLWPSWKVEKCDVSNHLNGLNNIWHGDASQPLGRCWPLRFPKFINPRWPPVTISKIEKSWYLHNHLTNFTEIWHGNASQRFAPRQPLKFPKFKNPRKVQHLVREVVRTRTVPYFLKLSAIHRALPKWLYSLLFTNTTW